MNTTTIDSFANYISYVEDHYSRDHIFRGIHNLRHKLIPKIGREQYLARCDTDPTKKLDGLQDLEEQAIQEQYCRETDCL